ncbi:inositol monophosphatase family protein [Streptomyces misionensis]|uniref:inositol monophosphatase family protein n=1 Tax=Streptomyces misionensis TaxID=67331 RepID=UPI00341D8123
MLDGVFNQAVDEVASFRARRSRSATGLHQRLQNIITSTLAEAWPDVPVITATPGNRGVGALPGDCVLLNPLDGEAEFVAGSPHFAITACRVRRGFPIQGIVDLPDHHVRLSIDRAALTISGDIDRLPVFDADTILTRPDDAARVSRILAGRPVEAVATASILMALIALRRARVAVHLPGREMATPWNYAGAALAVHTSGGTVRSPDGRDLAHSPLAVHTGWLATCQPPRPAELTQLLQPPD